MNRIVHEPSRLKLLALLATGEETMGFTALRDELGMTAGNLSIQLKKLEEAGYVQTVKYFAEGKPRTDITLSESGRVALLDYLESLERIRAGIKPLKKER